MASPARAWPRPRPRAKYQRVISAPIIQETAISLSIELLHFARHAEGSLGYGRVSRDLLGRSFRRCDSLDPRDSSWRREPAGGSRGLGQRSVRAPARSAI